MHGATFCTDHRLLISKINLHITSPKRLQDTRVPKPLKTSKLKKDLVRQKLVHDLHNYLPPPNTDPNVHMEAEWARFRDVVYAAASEVVGPITGEHQD